MPQMKPLLWTMMLIQSIIILLLISSFLYFMQFPFSQNFTSPKLMIKSPTFCWTW